MNAPVVLTPDAAAHTAERIAALLEENRQLRQTCSDQAHLIRQQRASLALLKGKGAA